MVYQIWQKERGVKLLNKWLIYKCFKKQKFKRKWNKNLQIPIRVNKKIKNYQVQILTKVCQLQYVWVLQKSLLDLRYRLVVLDFPQLQRTKMKKQLNKLQIFKLWMKQNRQKKTNHLLHLMKNQFKIILNLVINVKSRLIRIALTQMMGYLLPYSKRKQDLGLNCLYLVLDYQLWPKEMMARQLSR